MIYTHKQADRRHILKDLQRKDDSYFYQWVEVNVVLSKFGTERFTASERDVLNFIASRTLLFRKKGETIFARHFLEGVHSENYGTVCVGAGVSINTLSKVLKSLEQKGVIDIHRFLDGKHESVARLYVIKHEEIIRGYDLEEVREMLNKRRPMTVRVESDEQFDDFDNDEHVKKPGTPIVGGGGPTRKGITDTLRVSRKASKDKEESATDAPRLRVGKKHVARGEIDCTAEERKSATTARAKLSEMVTTSTAKRATRLQAVKGMPAKRWEVTQLQAVLDQARADSGVTTARIIVTAKGMGLLYKRMKEAEVSDALEFFTWTMKNWSTVAGANRRSKATQLKDTKAVNSEMSQVPNFSDLAYRFPYILVFFNDRKFVEVQKQEQQEEKTRQAKRTIETQQQAIERRRKAVHEQDLRDLEEEREQDRKSAQRIRSRRVEDMNDDDVVPVYRERTWSEYNGRKDN
jgi:hypothetical protein